MSAKRLDSPALVDLARRRKVPLVTRADLGAEAPTDIAGGLNAILADVFALYMKTKKFHWHMSGPHFHDYHLLVRGMVDERRDVAAASLIESWIDDAERRTWFLFETTRSVD